ncbi:hypothetical protein JEM48_04825 [Ligilactobacillus salivarius]|uniref:hypothetical protein n=1 Tax=Ligilactobacillus salivarius TaxID=1624 RepID=UPI00191FF620|nr:hypothetical protein [Ligilactobacillus salivarius]MBL1057975.1 hypothetical protein [Ligilactobacillus salivarius]
MNIKKLSKLFYINGTNGGNKGILPERGKGPAPVPKRPFGERLRLISGLANIDEMKEKGAFLNEVYDDIKDRLIETAREGRYSWSITELDLLNMAGKHNLPEWCGIEQLLIFLKGECEKDDIRVDISDFRLDLSSDLSRIVEFSWNK